MTDDPDDEAREYVRRLFATEDPVPRDVVPGSGLTREAVLRMNENTGKLVTGTIPGEVIVDVDGLPIGVEPSREITSIFGGVALTLAELTRLGLTPADVPNVHLIDPPPTHKEQP